MLLIVILILQCKCLNNLISTTTQALLGPIAAAAYNLTFQLGFATTQICESVAVAVQTLLAREIAGGKGASTSTTGSESESKSVAASTTSAAATAAAAAAAGMRAMRVRHLINGSIFVGGLVAGSLSLLTFFQREGVLRGLTTDIGVREASAIIFPAVLITQGENFLSCDMNVLYMFSFANNCNFVQLPSLYNIIRLNSS